MAALGWMLACVLGVLTCMLAADARGNDAPWQILGALVLGSMLAVVPVGVTLFAAYRAFGGTPPARVAIGEWRWTVLAVLCGVEFLVLALSVVAAAADDDSLLFSIPFNLAIVIAGLIVGCWPSKETATRLSRRWTAFLVLCGVEFVSLVLTVLAGVLDDDSFLVSIPVNVIIVFAAVLVGCWPFRRRATIVLCLIHLIGCAFATLAAAIEIESVVVSGFLLVFTALALAILGTPRPASILFALSTMVFAVTSFLVIAIGGFNQREADAPLFAAMVAYQILFAPIGLFALYRAFSQRGLPTRVQFGLRQMLGAMVVVCVAAAATRLALSLDNDLQVAVAVFVGALVVAGIAVVFAAEAWAKWSSATIRLNESQAA